MGLLDLFNQWIVERGSAVVQSKHLSFFKDQLILADRKTTELEEENSVLTDKIKILEAELKQSEEQRRTLEKQIVQKNHDEFLIFNQRTGTWIDKKISLHYCPKCKANNKLSPMKNEQHGWNCGVCGKNYWDPDRPLPSSQDFEDAWDE